MGTVCSRGIICRLHGKSRKIHSIISIITAYCFLSYNIAVAQQIVTDGKTRTTLTINDNVTDVTTLTVHGKNAFNSFSVFDVYDGNVVNLYVPDDASNLINLVNTRGTVIDGKLNSIMGGQIGGNIFFVNPYGFVVGEKGTINTGALNVVTPAADYMKNFFDISGDPSRSSVEMLLNGSVPVSESGLISIRGKVNAINDIRLKTGSFMNSGLVASGAVFSGSRPDFSDIVNVDGIENGTGFSIENGEIYIRAEKELENSGTIKSDGSSNLNAGIINIEAGNDIKLLADSAISARGLGYNSSGGDIHIYAEHDALFNKNAIIDVRGGDISGDGGFIELSAAKKVTMDGGIFKAYAENGSAGSILIDPEDIEIVSDNKFEGGDYTLQANQSITVNPGVIISTRNLIDPDNDDHLTADSTGDSGNLTLEAPQITLSSGSMLLAHVEDGSSYKAGNISLKAVNTEETSLVRLAGNESKSASISITGATIKGGDISITSEAGDTNPEDGDPTALESWTIGELETLLTENVTLPVAVMIKRADATIKINEDNTSPTVISGSGNINISADSTADGTVKAISGGTDPITMNPVLNVFSVGYSKADATSKVEVGKNVTIDAGGDVTLSSDASATASVTARTSQNLGVSPNNKDNIAVSVAIAKSNTTSHATVAENSSINAGGSISVNSTGQSTNYASAETGTYDDGLAGIAVGLGFNTSDIRSRVNGNLTSDGSLSEQGIEVTAGLTASETSSGVAGLRGDPLVKDALLKGEIASFLPFIMTGTLKNLRKNAGWFGTDSDLSLAGSLAYADSTNTVTSEIAGSAVLKSKMDVDVTASISDRVQTAAESVISNDGENDNAISAAVIVGSYSNTSKALIDDNASVDAGQDLLIDSTITYPFLTEPAELYTLEDFSGPAKLGTLLDQKLGIQSKLFNSWARSVGKGDDGSFGISGSVDYMNFTNDSEAVIGKNALINQDTDYQTDAQAISLNAETNMKLVDMSGIFDINLQASTLDELKKKKDSLGNWISMGASGSYGGIGGAALLMFLNNTTVAQIDDGAKVHTGTEGDLTVNAKTDITNIALVQSGASAGTFAVGASFSYVDQDDTTTAKIDSGSIINTGEATVSAKDETILFNVAGGVVKGQNLGIGASVSINNIARNTQALIGHATFDPLSCITGNTVNLGYNHGYSTGVAVVYLNGGGASIEGLTEGDTYYIVVVNPTTIRLAKDPEGTQIVDIAASADMGVSHMFVKKDGSFDSDGDIGIAAENRGSISSYSLAAAIASSKKDDNTKEEKTPVPDKVDKDDPLDGVSLPNLFDEKKEEGETQNTKPKASFAIAGDVSINMISDKTDAGIKAADITNSTDIDISALSNSGINSIAGAAAISSSDGTSVGLAGSVTYNSIDTGTNAYIIDSDVTNTGALDLSADTINTIRTISASGSMARKDSSYALAGSVSVNDIEGDTLSYVNRSVIDSTDKVEISATDQSTIWSIAGSASYGGKAGIGASVAVNSIEDITEAFSMDSDILSEEDIVISSDESSEIKTVAAAVGAAKSGMAIAGSVSVNDLDNTTRAYIKDKKDEGVTADNNISLSANDDADILSIAGNIAFAKGSGGVSGSGFGGSASVLTTNNTVESYIGTGSKVTAKGKGDEIAVYTGQKDDDGNNLTENINGISVTATSKEEILSIAAGFAGAEKLAVEGSAAVHNLNETTSAHIDWDAEVLSGDPDEEGRLTGTEQSVNLLAYDFTDILGIAGAASASMSGGIGAGADVGVIRKNTFAYIDNNADVDVTKDILLKSKSGEDINSISAAVSLGKSWALGGAASVYDIRNNTKAYINGGDVSTTDVHADGNILVSAENNTEIDNIAGSVSAGAKAGVGASATVAIIDKTTEAFIGKNAKVTADGNRDEIDVATGRFTVQAVDNTGDDYSVDPSDTENLSIDGDDVDTGSVSSNETKQFKGLAVTAISKDDISSIAASGGGSGNVAVNLAGSVNIVGNNTSAYIGEGAVINNDISSAGDEQSLLVAAGTDLRHLGIGAAAALSGNVGLGPAAEVTVVDNNTSAFVGKSAEVKAKKDIEVVAESNQDILSITGSAALGVGAVGLAGSVSVISIDNQTSAYLADTTGSEDATDVSAGGNIAISTKDNTETDIIAGSVAGGSVGIGGAVGVTLIEKDTRAYAGDNAVVNAKGNSGNVISAYSGQMGEDGSFTKKNIKGLSIQASSIEDFSTITGAGAGGYAGVAGAVVVNNIKSDTSAYTGDSAQINQDNEDAGTLQDVNISAVNNVNDFGVSGSLAVGGVGLSGGIGFHNINNNTSAYLGNETSATAAHDIDLNALSNKEAETYAISAAGGVVGVAGGVTIFTVGQSPDESSAGEMAARGGNDGYEDPSSYAEEQAGYDLLGGVLGDSYGMDDVKTKAGDETGAITGSPATVSAGTSSFIGKSADVQAGNNINLNAKERYDIDITSGAGAAGFAGLGGGVGVADINSTVKAYIDDNEDTETSVNADGNININAKLDDTTLNRAYAGGLSYLLSVSGAVSYTADNYLVDAHIGKNVIIDNADTISVLAESDTDDTSKSGEVAASFGLGVGVSYAEVDSTDTTQSYVEDNAKIGTADGKAVGSLNVKAGSSNTAHTDSKHIAGGIIAGGYNESDSDVTPTVKAFIGSDAEIHLQDDLNVTARAEVDSTAYTWGGSFGGVGIGVGVAEAKTTPTVKSFITGGNLTDISAENIEINAYGNYGWDGLELTDKTIRAENDATAGSILLSHNSPSATADSEWTVNAYIGDDADIESEGDLNITAKSYSGKVYSDVDGNSYSLAALGNNISTSTSNNTVKAYIGEDSSVTSDYINIYGYGKSDTYATTYGGAGGIIAGASASANTYETNMVNAWIAGNKDTSSRIHADSDISLMALSDIIFNSHASTTGYGFVGSNGARLNNTVSSTAKSYIGTDAYIDAGNDISVNARNNIYKFNIGTNLSAGAGGFWGGPAGDSTTTITDTAEAYVAGNSTADEDNSIKADNDITVSAANNVYAYDKATLSAGGAIAVADVHSTITDTNTAKAYVGGNARIASGNDINLDSISNANIEAVTYTEGFGLGASADGTASTTVTTDNDTSIGENSVLTAGRDINIFAGKDINGLQNNLRARSETRSFSAGGIPFSSLKSYAYINDYNDILVGSGAYLRAGGDINAGSYIGSAYRDAYARAKLRTYALFGIPITWYSNGTRVSSLNKSDSVTINGNLESGINHSKLLEINADGTIGDNSNIYPDLIAFNKNVDGAVMLQERIDHLTGQIADESDENVKIILAQERSRYEDRLTEINNGRLTDPTYGYFDLYSLDNITVGSGDINITGTVAGNGSLKVPGNDFFIDIQNDSLAHLDVNNLEIPDDLSGNVILNNRVITSYNTLNIDPGKNSGKRIIIENTYDPDEPGVDVNAASDITLRGDITNHGGSINITNNSGSIESLGDITGDEVTIYARMDFAQAYTKGLWQVGSNPLISGGNINISGEVLDINGTIQSGTAYRAITIPEFDPSALVADKYGRKYIPTTGDSNIRAYWDDNKQCIMLYDVKVTGGNITLAGDIVSTGGGALKVIDGYGEINVTNNSSKDMVINKLDTGNRISGKIKITDTGKLDINGNPLVTEISRSNGNINTVQYRIRWNEENGKIEVVDDSSVSGDPVEGRNTQYNPRTGAKYFAYGDDYVITNQESYPWYTSEYWLLSLLGNKADYGIDVQFMGSDQSGIDITSSSSGNLLFNGDVRSRYGDVSVTNVQGNIYSLNQSALISGQNISFSSGGDMGTTDQAVRIDTLGGLFKGNASGQVNIAEKKGALTIDSIITDGDAVITADGSIFGLTDKSTTLSATNITIISENGGIGNADNHFRINSMDGVINAGALNDIFITETEGEMRVDRVASTQGDVTLAADGPILDYNFPENTDDDTSEQVASAKADLGLDSGEKVQEAIDAYKQQKKDEYQDKHRISDNDTPFEPGDDTYDDSYDPNWEYTLTASEENAFEESIWKEDELINAKNILSLPGSTTGPEEANVSGRNITLISKANIGVYGGDEIISHEDIASGNFSDAQKLLLVHAEKNEASYDDEGNVIISLDKNFNIQATGNINIQAGDYVFLASENDMNIVTISAVSGNIELTSGGSILNAYDDNGVNLSGSNITISSLTGNTGSIDRALRINTRDGLLHVDAAGLVSLFETEGDLIIDNVTAKENAIIGADGSILDLSGSCTSITAANITLISENGGIGHGSNVIAVDSLDGILNAEAFQGIYLNESDGTMRINRITSIEGDITLSSGGSIIKAASDDGANLTGKNIILSSADGSIGNIDGSVRINTLGGALNAEALQGIYITETDGAMNVDRVESAEGDVVLTSDGSILNAASEDETNVIGKNIRLSAADDIGNTLKAIRMDSEGVFNADATGLINITETEGDLTIGYVTTKGDSIITADGAILDLNEESAGITALNITLRSVNGGIGLTGNHLSVNSLDGILNADALQGIYIAETDGTMRVDHVASSEGDVVLAADGSIINSASDGIINTRAKNITLSSSYGSIGDFGNTRLVADSDGVFNMTAYGDIYLEEYEGDFISDLVSSLTGQIDILVRDGGADIETLSAARDIGLKANNGDLLLDTLVSASADISVSKAGGNLLVNNAMVSAGINLNADNITVLNAVHTGPGPLSIRAGGGSSETADSVAITAFSPDGVNFERLSAETAEINATGRLLINNATINKNAAFTNGPYMVILDNVNRTLLDTDLQLYSENNRFYLYFPDGDRRYSTDSFIVNYDDDFTINGPSSENSITRMVPKLLSVTGYAGKRLEDNAFINMANIPLSGYMTLSGYIDYGQGWSGIDDKNTISDEDDLILER
jgi:filamentous hemagglutinin family protein